MNLKGKPVRCAPDGVFMLLYMAAAITVSYWLGAFVSYYTESFGAGWFVSCSVYVLAAWEWSEAQLMETNLCERDEEL